MVFMGLTSLTLPAQWYFACPAFLSACWIGNTILTLTMAQIIKRNPDRFEIQTFKDEIDKYRRRNAELDVELKELKDSYEDIQFREEKILTMQVCKNLDRQNASGFVELDFLTNCKKINKNSDFLRKK